MKKVVVGMSGGVDSSVSAALLKEQGYEVVGLHMKNANASQETEDVVMAKGVCDKLGIEFVSMDYSDEMQTVKDYFVSEYKQGRTPNPCVLCNREVKFKPFIDYANKIGADYFATGHYARVEHNGNVTKLMKGIDESKDQSYFLNQLTQAQLGKAIFPLGEMTKVEVRKIAEDKGLVSAHKKDSFDVCFIGSQKFKDFMHQICPEKPGKIIDIESGKIVGKHQGLSAFTVGQRRGVGVGGQSNETGRWFVVKKDLKNNILYVSTNEKKYLFSKQIVVGRINWIPSQPEKKNFECCVKIRYRQADQKAIVILLDDAKAKIDFVEGQRAIAVGQYAVFYDGQQCLGGGVIEEVQY